MREGIGEWFTYNIIFIFILIVFGLLSATISYYKAFKVNNRILYSIDKYEGYNKLSKSEINDTLYSLGYTVNDGSTCPSKRDNGLLTSAQKPNYLYCVYYYYDDSSAKEEGKKTTDKKNQPIYYNYSVVTYIYVDLPLVDRFKVPVYTKGERIYNFSDNQEQKTI